MMKMGWLQNLAGAVVLVVLASSSSYAQQGNAFGGFKHDNSQPIEIVSDSLTVRHADQEAIFTGNVVATQGTLTLNSDEMTVYYTDEENSETGAIERVYATGDVFLTNAAETAQGKWADYDVLTGMVTMGGDVVLTQGDNAVAGESLTIDLNEGTGSVSGGRVKSIFTPKSDDSGNE